MNRYCKSLKEKKKGVNKECTTMRFEVKKKKFIQTKAYLIR